MAKGATKRKPATKIAKGAALSKRHFDLPPIVAPTLEIGIERYKEYLQCYEIYRSAVESFRSAKNGAKKLARPGGTKGKGVETRVLSEPTGETSGVVGGTKTSRGKADQGQPGDWEVVVAKRKLRNTARKERRAKVLAQRKLKAVKPNTGSVKVRPEENKVTRKQTPSDVRRKAARAASRGEKNPATRKMLVRELQVALKQQAIVAKPTKAQLSYAQVLMKKAVSVGPAAAVTGSSGKLVKSEGAEAASRVYAALTKSNKNSTSSGEAARRAKGVVRVDKKASGEASSKKNRCFRELIASSDRHQWGNYSSHTVSGGSWLTGSDDTKYDRKTCSGCGLKLERVEWNGSVRLDWTVVSDFTTR